MENIENKETDKENLSSKKKALNLHFNSENRSKTVFFILVGVFIALDIFIAVFLFATRHFSPIFFESYQSPKMTRLYALDKNAHKSQISKIGMACYKFSEYQMSTIKDIYEDFETAGITVRIHVLPSKTENSDALPSQQKLYFKYGFLDSYDFSEKGKFIPLKYITNQRIVVQGNLEHAPEYFDVSFALKKSDNISSVIPRGFFIYVASRCRIEGVYVSPAKMGFDSSSAIPFYGFAATGGEVDFSNSYFDFSGAPMLFSSKGKDFSLSQFEIKFSDDENLKSKIDESVRSQINFGGENLSVKNVQNAKKIILPAAALKSPYSQMQIKTHKECIKSVILQNDLESLALKNQDSSFEPVYPVKTDPGLILNYPQENWRSLDYEIFAWDRFSKIIFFDTRNYDVQDRFFRRIAYFVEKAGYKGRILSDSELEGKHGYNAHDYSSESLAAFFNKAEELNFELNDEEKLLKRILIANDFFESDGKFVKAHDGGLISISRETAAWSRANLLAHEGWHTLFFRDADFRNFVSAVYHTMDSKSLDFLIKYFQSQISLGYDTTDDYLMNNEFMAYMLQQPLSAINDYYVSRASWASVTKYCPEDAAYIRRTNAQGLEDAAIALNEYVFDAYGLIAGNISLVSR